MPKPPHNAKNYDSIMWRALYNTPVSGLNRNCVATDHCCEIQAFETCECPPHDVLATTEYTLTFSSFTNQFESYGGVNIYYESLIVEKRDN